MARFLLHRDGFCSIAAASAVLAGITTGCCAAGARAGAPAQDAPAAIVVGTIHKGHLLQKQFPLGVLRQLLEAANPDLVLVEIRPGPFEQGHFEDGPFEMTYVTLLARAKGVEVVPIDWFDDSQAPDKEPQIPAVDRKKMDEELERIPVLGYGPFRQMQSLDVDRNTAMRLNVLARYTGNVEWDKRQAWMNHYALAAARERRANTVLAFVGGQHRLELEQYFRANGYVIRNPTSVVSEPSSTQEPAPESVLSAWKAGIQRLREAAAKSTPEWKQRLMSKIRYFEVAVEQKGRCCVSDDALKP